MRIRANGLLGRSRNDGRVGRLGWRLTPLPLPLTIAILVTQPPYPLPPYPYRVIRDPLPLCRRAGWIAFALGMLISLNSIFTFAKAYTNSPESFYDLQQQDLRTLTRDAATRPSEELFPFSPAGSRNFTLISSAFVTAVGLTMMILASPVRRGSKPAVVTSTVVVGGVAAFLALMTAASAFLGLMSPLFLGVACCMSVPLSLSIWLFVLLIVAVRAISAAQQAAMMMRAGHPGFGVPGGAETGGNSSGAEETRREHTFPTEGPSGYPPAPNYEATPPAKPDQLQPPAAVPPAAGPQSMFGPAPFGIPPPPGDTPAGKYGYPTRPSGGKESATPAGTVEI